MKRQPQGRGFEPRLRLFLQCFPVRLSFLQCLLTKPLVGWLCDAFFVRGWEQEWVGGTVEGKTGEVVVVICSAVRGQGVSGLRVGVHVWVQGLLGEEQV